MLEVYTIAILVGKWYWTYIKENFGGWNSIE